MVDHTVLVGEPADLHFEVDDLSEREVWSSRRRELLDEVGAVLGRNRVGHEFKIIAQGPLPTSAQHPTETKPSLQRGQGFFSLCSIVAGWLGAGFCCRLIQSS